MREIIVTSVEDFLAQLRLLAPVQTDFLFRGQADVDWKVDCSAARRLNQDRANPIDLQLFNSLLVGYSEFLIASARERELIPPGLDKNSPDLEFLAQLQHYGAATGLIDFTRKPLVALWFACNGAQSEEGAVYLLPYSVTTEIGNDHNLVRKFQSFYEDNRLWSWKPVPRGSRIGAQHSVFVFGTPQISPDLMTRLVIRADSKSGILSNLKTVHDITEEGLSPDFPGYAVANAHIKSFNPLLTIPYWLDQAESALDKTQKANAHFQCGLAFGGIGKFTDAIGHFTAAIESDPMLAEAFNNRASLRKETNNLRKR